VRRRDSITFLSFQVAVVFMLLVGCSTTPPIALERARVNFAKAQQDPQISSHAPVAVHEARESLRRAEESWEKEGDREETEHLAYLTEQRTEIARSMTQRRLAEAEAQQLAQERDRVRLEARTREAERARELAELRAREAQQARQGEQTQARQAELARELAEKQAREAETAREEALKRVQELELAKLQAQRATSRIQELETQLAEFKAKRTERGLELTLSDVLFEFDKADLKPGALRGLAPLVAFAKDSPDVKIVLEGHTDSVGSESYNIKLSQERAEAVQDFLLKNGVPAASLSARGLGESYPVATNDTAAGRQQNRRVQIIIADELVRRSEKK
jgi:outer membrane protein OmpA-like peptidoglycan-associated protein